MAKAYKCDRCGKFYEENIISHENERRYLVTKNVKGDGMIREHDFDLCGDCQDALEKFLLKQMFTADEVFETLVESSKREPRFTDELVRYMPTEVYEILTKEGE